MQGSLIQKRMLYAFECDQNAAEESENICCAKRKLKLITLELLFPPGGCETI